MPGPGGRAGRAERGAGLPGPSGGALRGRPIAGTRRLEARGDPGVPQVTHPTAAGAQAPDAGVQPPGRSPPGAAPDAPAGQRVRVPAGEAGLRLTSRRRRRRRWRCPGWRCPRARPGGVLCAAGGPRSRINRRPRPGPPRGRLCRRGSRIRGRRARTAAEPLQCRVCLLTSLGLLTSCVPPAPGAPVGEPRILTGAPPFVPKAVLSAR